LKLLTLNGGHSFTVNFAKYKIDWTKSPSKIQRKVQDFLLPYWEFDTVLSEYRIPGSLLRLDIFNCTKGIIVEISPEDHHGQFNKFFHKDRNHYLHSIKRDFAKIEWANKNNLNLVELNYMDVNNLSPKYIKDKYGINI
jgi:hypothetical protein